MLRMIPSAAANGMWIMEAVMKVIVQIKIADSVEAEEAAGRTGQAVPTTVTVDVFVDRDEPEWIDAIYDGVADELIGMGFGGLEFEILHILG